MSDFIVCRTSLELLALTCVDFSNDVSLDFFIKFLKKKNSTQSVVLPDLHEFLRTFFADLHELHFYF